jgi:hypothetical protein
MRWLSRHREVRQAAADATLASLWEQALPYLNECPNDSRSRTCVGQITRHRQLARTGTKAYVRWCGDQIETAAWFAAAWPPVGSYVVATGDMGYGEHHTEEVFYVSSAQLHLVMPPSAPLAWTRLQRRLAAAT